MNKSYSLCEDAADSENGISYFGEGSIVQRGVFRIIWYCSGANDVKKIHFRFLFVQKPPTKLQEGRVQRVNGWREKTTIDELFLQIVLVTDEITIITTQPQTLAECPDLCKNVVKRKNFWLSKYAMSNRKLSTNYGISYLIINSAITFLIPSPGGITVCGKTHTLRF